MVYLFNLPKFPRFESFPCEEKAVMLMYAMRIVIPGRAENHDLFNNELSHLHLSLAMYIYTIIHTFTVKSTSIICICLQSEVQLFGEQINMLPFRASIAAPAMRGCKAA